VPSIRHANLLVMGSAHGQHWTPDTGPVATPVHIAGITLEIEDTRKDYGEIRIICFGHLEGRMVVVGYTPRAAGRHVFSMRKANEREQSRIAPLLKI